MGPVVLLVEDDPSDVFFMQRAWKTAGVPLPLHVVSDGESAVQYIAGRGAFADRERHPMPAFVLLDLKIPLLSGVEVLRWIRTESEVRTLPVYVLTSSADPGDIQETRALGVSEYIVKPASFAGLLEVVKRFAKES